MTIEELFQEPDIKLPIEQKPGTTFRKTLFDCLDNYLNLIKGLDFSGTSIAVPSAEILRVKNFVEAIKKAIDFYLQGHPFSAYEELKKALDASSIFSYLKNESYSIGNNFFRLRENESNFSLPKGELFHIPFQLRAKVATQRYSIPGFPCLYISDSVYVAWEELRRPSLDNIQAIRLKNIEPIKFLDLTTDIFLGDAITLSLKTLDDLWAHLITWPLIAACSVKVLDRNPPFKPEYIIPQLVLQIIRKEGTLDAIRFSSTHTNRNKVDIAGTFYNLAIPVKDDNDNGYCSSMKKMFEMTDPVPWEIRDVFANPHGTFIYPSSPFKAAVKSITLMENHTLDYEYSTFGKLEEALTKMTPTSLT